MYPHRLRATAIDMPHTDDRKQTCAFNKKDAQIGEKDFSHANRVRMQSPSPCLQRRIGGACSRAPQLAQLAKLRARQWRLPNHVVGFTKEVHQLMRAADFLIGKAEILAKLLGEPGAEPRSRTPALVATHTL